MKKINPHAVTERAVAMSLQQLASTGNDALVELQPMLKELGEVAE